MRPLAGAWPDTCTVERVVWTMKSHQPAKASRSQDDSDAGLYVRPLSLRILIPVSLAIAALVAMLSFYLGNETVPTAEHPTPLLAWTIRAVVLLVALAAGWRLTRRPRQ
jgi:cation transport ATPase